MQLRKIHIYNIIINKINKIIYIKLLYINKIIYIII